MTHYTARVLDDRRLELPQGALSLIAPGQEIEIDVADMHSKPSGHVNEVVQAMLRDLAEMKKDMPESDPSDTDAIIRGGRAGGMYDEPA